MDHEQYRLDGLPINSKGIDCDPTTGERFQGPTPLRGQLSMEINTVTAIGDIPVAWMCFACSRLWTGTQKEPR